MSIKAYRLLRNNKEEGPFTVEEIIQRNLKPYDLIWVDGRSAAWSYPGELTELKMYAPLPGEENLNASVNKQPAAVSSSVHAAIAVNNAIVQPAIKQKPRYKISAAWSKIQTVTAPVYNEEVVAKPQKKPLVTTPQTNIPASFQSKSLSWEEAWLDWEKEKTVTEAIPVVQSPKPVSIKQKAINDNYIAPVLETKFTQPLDNLKDKYIENILQQKQKSKKGFSLGKASEFIVPSLALLIIFSVGYWLLHSTQIGAAVSSVPAKTQQPLKTENTNALPANTNNNNSAANTVLPNTVSNEPQDITSTNTPVSTDKAEDRKPTYAHAAKFTAPKQENNFTKQNKFPATQIILPDKKPSASEKTIDKPVKQFDPSVINNIPTNNAYNDASPSNTGDLNAADARPVKRRTNNAGDNSNNQSTQTNQVTATKSIHTKSSSSYVNVPEYIEINNGSANLKIQNVSDVDLDLVVVDVQYYDASGRFRKGETLYLHNLRAGKNVIVKTPKDVTSQYATSKISLVSSDANNLYVVGDN